MKENLKDFLFNLFTSMFIGLVVGLVQITAVNMSSETAAILIECIIIGGVIGTISKLIFLYIFDIKQKDVKLAFIAVFIVIGAISSMPNFYYYIFEGVSISKTELIPILVSAEILGMGFCYYSYKRYLQFNSKLINKKKQLTNN